MRYLHTLSVRTCVYNLSVESCLNRKYYLKVTRVPKHKRTVTT